MSRAALILSIIVMCLASPARAERVECYVSIDGRELMTGPCEFKTNSRSILFLSVPGSTITARDGEIIPDEITVNIHRLPGGTVTPSPGRAALLFM